MSSPEVLITLNFTGSTFKEKMIEFVLMVSGKIFYFVVLRPVEYFRSGNKKNGNPNDPPASQGPQA